MEINTSTNGNFNHIKAMNTIQYTISERTNRLLNLRHQLETIHGAISQEAESLYGTRAIDDIMDKYVTDHILELHKFLDDIVLMSICDNTASQGAKAI